MLSLSSFLLASLSFCAAVAAIWSCVRVRKQLGAASVRSLVQLSTEVAELTSAFESLSASHRKLAARVGMREVRQRGEEQREAAVAAAAPVSTTPMDREKLKEIARARGFKLT